VFKERPVRKLVDQYIGLYTIEEVVSTNAVKLQLPTSMRIHPVMSGSQEVDLVSIYLFLFFSPIYFPILLLFYF